MALSTTAEEYFRTLNPIASKIYEDITEVKDSYESVWETLTDKEKVEILDESIIKPEIALKYAQLDTLDFDLNELPIRKNDLMSFFGREHGQRVVQDDNICFKDEHSAPFIFQTKSQLNLCVLSEHRALNEVGSSPPPVVSELVLSHSKVVNELKNALKSHDILKSACKEKESHHSQIREVLSPTGFMSRLMGNFKSKDEERECLVSSVSQTQVIASSENFFKTNFKSTQNTEKDYRSSIIVSSSDLSDENRGLLSSSLASSGTDFHSTETLTDSNAVPKTGYDFLDNW